MNVSFDENTIIDNRSNRIALGVADGLLIRVEYSHDYDWTGESWQGGPVVEGITCPVSGHPIVIDHEDECFVDALSAADSTHEWKKAGYGK